MKTTQNNTNITNPTISNVKARKKKVIIAVVAAVAVLIAIMIALSIAFHKEEPAPEPVATATPSPSPTPTPTPAPTPEVVIPIDFATLQAQNPHVYAWIQIPDTNINYPILQHPEDNSYYLEHNMDGSEGYPGCIYTELYNTKDFTDPNTVIYGHNMKNGTMFKHLHKFKDLSFFNSHRTMYIYTPTQILEYRIFAAYINDNSHLLYNNNFSDPLVFTEYLRSIMMKSGIIDQNINLNSANRIITMQTCTGNSETRLLVQAVLVDVKGEPQIIVPSTTVLTGDAVAQ